MSRPFDPRLARQDVLTTHNWAEPDPRFAQHMAENVTVDCGWGRLLFGQTFRHHVDLLKSLREEAPGQRDIAMYLRDPHILVARAPSELFIDPSLTYRLWAHSYRPAEQPVSAVTVRSARTQDDAEAMNRIYAANNMVSADPEVVWENQRTRTFTYLIAETADTGEIVGTVTGVDHVQALNDPEGGSSLWCLAVDPQCPWPGVGEALVRALAERFQAKGRAYMDLSVLHDNAGAISLYEKIGFERVPVFAVKRKNPINERLFAPPPETEQHLNPYARIIADEALRRGIQVRVIDAAQGYLELSHGGRTIVTRESLSELTTAVAMSRCDDKRVTRKILAEAGLRVPRGRTATFDEEDLAFLADAGQLVVKPARGEQGAGITVGVKEAETLRRAIERARDVCPTVLLEDFVEGHDLRVLVIDHEVVAAAVRRPATVVGNGRHTIEQLIRKQSRRRAAATGGESRIPLDEATEETVAAQGYRMNEVLPEGEALQVRRTANLHTGGTLHDVTEKLHPWIAEACITASQVLDIPVVGLDLLVGSVEEPEHVFIEANERPGLANHEPQPTAQRFVDLLFPRTRTIGA